MKPRHLVMIVLALMLVGQGAYHYPRLPETIASHFDGAGRADGWMSKGGFVLFEFVVLSFVFAFLLSAPKIIETMPDTLISLPNKSFWLARERRLETFAIFRAHFQWLAIGVLVLVICINQFAFTANIEGRELSSATWFLVGGFLVFVFTVCLKFCLRFRKDHEATIS